jgi:hypothetical protein
MTTEQKAERTQLAGDYLKLAMDSLDELSGLLEMDDDPPSLLELAMELACVGPDHAARAKLPSEESR